MPRYTTFIRVFIVCQSTRLGVSALQRVNSEWEAILQYRYEFGSKARIFLLVDLQTLLL